MTDPTITADLAAIERELAKLEAIRGKTDPQLLPILGPFHAIQEDELQHIRECRVTMGAQAGLPNSHS